MGSADCAHEIYDRHHHESGRNRPHARTYGPAASSSDDFATGNNHDQQERAPGFCEDAPPLEGVIQEISWQLPLGQCVVVCVLVAIVRIRGFLGRPMRIVVSKGLKTSMLH